jgi:hypothetical protein
VGSAVQDEEVEDEEHHDDRGESDPDFEWMVSHQPLRS